MRGFGRSDDEGTTTPVAARSEGAGPDRPRRARRGVATVVPGGLLLVSFVDDAVFGPVIVGLSALFGLWADVVAVAGFTTASIAAAAATAWALRRAPVEPDGAAARRLAKLRTGRLARHVLRAVGDGRPVATGVAAVALGCVAPVLLAEVGRPGSAGTQTVAVCGLSYGLAFSLSYGAVGRLTEMVA